ncbi:hypothetical protein K2173_010387 [Erythroxylum novogranatense]|uniref:DUF4005 domain-containing protein n=1 Tax=Erythroxylum novogranatense TaxID=1862640 RepID=A0AAV8TDI4_9ROSI|nr:hypothetical protein K2173_010387 [Erythroxylum novogranatense]
MKKNTDTSWLTLVKRALKSPTKEKEKSSRRRDDHNQLEEEGKMREKRRWLFSRKINQVQRCAAKTTTTNTTSPTDANLVEEQGHAIAVAASEAVAVTSQAEVQIIREQWAAVVIQTGFRGYLARRALGALKGLVKLQALVRGHNVRNQAKLTLKCMQTLVRVQDRVRDQRARLSHEGSRKSIFTEINGLWDSKYLQDIRERKSIIEAMVENRKEAAFKRERALAYAFSSQIWRSETGRKASAGSEKELEEKTGWPDRRMAAKQCEISNRASTDIKTIERRYRYQNHPTPTPYSVASPLHMFTPSPCRSRIKPLQVRSASPRLTKEEKHCYSHSPSFGYRQHSINNPANIAVPNYMASTESAKARIRSQSAPKHRPSTPEKAKKRLYYPPPEPLGCSLRSPSFKSLPCGHVGIQHLSNCHTLSLPATGGEISPSSRTDLKWLDY